LTKAGEYGTFQSNSMDIRKQLVSYSRNIARRELVLGSSGNISARSGTAMVIKASGTCMETARNADFLTVEIATLRYRHKTLRPSCELRLHAACYRSRPDIACVIHTHPLYATILASCSIKPVICAPEFMIASGGDVAVIPYICPGTPQLAQRVGSAVRNHPIIYLKNHGLLTVGATIAEAFMRTLIAEQMAKMQVISLMIGKKINSIGRHRKQQLLAATLRR